MKERRRAHNHVTGKLRVNNTELYYEDTGGDGEPVIFSHGLLWNTKLFQPQVSALMRSYRCISYDHRGQGRSAEGHGNEIDLETLCDDVVELIHALKLDSVHFCGLSLGGFVGMRLAVRNPQLIRSLILCATSADKELAENLPKYRMLNLIAKHLGPRFVADSVMPLLYGRTALRDPSRSLERKQWKAQLDRLRPTIWRATNGVLNRKCFHAQLRDIDRPTLVMVGEEDSFTPPSMALRIAEAIEDAKLVCIPRAGHTLTLEEPLLVNAALSDFLSSQRSKNQGRSVNNERGFDSSRRDSASAASTHSRTGSREYSR